MKIVAAILFSLISGNVLFAQSDVNFDFGARYSREQETPSLWVSEGFTDYYGSLSRYRAGLGSKEDFLRSAANAISATEQNPARNYVSPAEASMSTWLCYETACAFQLSYYVAGHNLAALLDLSIRHDSAGTHDLDDLMRSLYADLYKHAAASRLTMFWHGLADWPAATTAISSCASPIFSRQKSGRRQN